MEYSQWTEIWRAYEATGKSFALVVTASLFLVFYYTSQGPRSNIPLANPEKGLYFSRQRAKKEFVSQANTLVSEWFKTNPNKPMRLIGDVKEVTVLPPSLAQEIRNDKRLSFNQWTFKVLSSYLLHHCRSIGIPWSLAWF
jgi:hypothetical protein